MKTEDRGLRIEDGKLGGEENPMDKGHAVRSAECRLRNERVSAEPLRQGGKAKYEDLSLKTRFRAGHLINRGSRGRAGLMRYSVESRVKCFGPGCFKMGRSMNHWPGRGGYLVEIPLSPSLSPLVPHGERENLCKYDFGMSGCSGASSPSGTACAWSGDGCSLISTCFHLFPLVAAVFIIKIFFGAARSAGRAGRATRGGNSAKLA